jgi:hypothetical protein
MAFDGGFCLTPGNGRETFTWGPNHIFQNKRFSVKPGKQIKRKFVGLLVVMIATLDKTNLYVFVPQGSANRIDPFAVFGRRPSELKPKYGVDPFCFWSPFFLPFVPFLGLSLYYILRLFLSRMVAAPAWRRDANTDGTSIHRSYYSIEGLLLHRAFHLPLQYVGPNLVVNWPSLLFHLGDRNSLTVRLNWFFDIA